MNTKVTLSIISLLMLLSILACGNSADTSNLPPPAAPSVPTATPIPPVEPIPGWLQFQGQGVSLWLPETFFGGHPATNLTAITEYLKQYGDPGQKASIFLQHNPNMYALWAFDTLAAPGGYLNNVHVTTENIFADVTTDQYVASTLKKLPIEFTHQSTDRGTLHGLDTARVILEFHKPDGSGRQVVYIMRTMPTEIWTVTYSAGLDVFDQFYPIFEQSVQTFRVGVTAETASPPPADPPTTALVFDDFSDSGSGWDTYSNELASRFYQDGSYHFIINTEKTLFWAVKGESYDNISVAADVTVAKALAPGEIIEAGLVCGYHNAAAFYFASILSDGRFGILQMTADQEKFIGSDSYQASDVIRPGAASNHVRIDCVGPHIRLYVNNTLVQQVDVGANINGQTGLLSGSFEWRDAHVSFDNFQISGAVP